MIEDGAQKRRTLKESTAALRIHRRFGRRLGLCEQRDVRAESEQIQKVSDLCAVVW